MTETIGHNISFSERELCSTKTIRRVKADKRTKASKYHMGSDIATNDTLCNIFIHYSSSK